MKYLRHLILPILLAVGFFGGVLFHQFGIPAMSKTTFLKLQEPLLLSAEGGQKNFHMLPAGTALYKDYSFAEGHTRYIVYLNIKGTFTAERIESDKTKLIDPIWGFPVQSDDLPGLIADTRISKDDLVRILKARKMTREELARIVREWQD